MMFVHNQQSALLVLVAFALVVSTTWCFAPALPQSFRRSGAPAKSILSLPLLKSSVSDVEDTFTGPESSSDLDTMKVDLIRACARDTKPSLDEIRGLVQDLEAAGEQLGIGQASSSSGLLNGEWELLYSPEDDTRASPFFWAFRKAFPDTSDQIFDITDAIPAPFKEVGPAFQHLDFNADTQTGRFVSKVKVATLGGMATSIMTTRGTIEGTQGYDGLVLKIDTTKPEDSTIVQKLFPRPLGDVVNENAPPFPSGQVLEQVAPGCSTVVMRTTYCDETIRISRNDEKMEDPFVWKRREFSSFDML